MTAYVLLYLTFDFRATPAPFRFVFIILANARRENPQQLVLNLPPDNVHRMSQSQKVTKVLKTDYFVYFEI